MRAGAIWADWCRGFFLQRRNWSDWRKEFPTWVHGVAGVVCEEVSFTRIQRIDTNQSIDMRIGAPICNRLLFHVPSLVYALSRLQVGAPLSPKVCVERD